MSAIKSVTATFLDMLRNWQRLIFLQGCPNLSRRDRQGTCSRPLQLLEIVGCSKIAACCMCDYGIPKSKFTHQLLTLITEYIK